MTQGGPIDGRAPRKVAKLERSKKVVAVYPEIEQLLLNVQLVHPRGDPYICKKNDKKFRAILNQFFVDEETMLAINGRNLCRCSGGCLDEESKKI